MTHAELADSDDYRALLRGVLIDPDDDLPRLVLADWLDENGCGDRATVIRWACDYASDPNRAPVLHCVCKDGVAFPCLFCGVPAWLHALARPWPRFSDEPQLGTSRGFVASIRLTQADFLAHAAAIFSRHPVTAVTLSDRHPFNAPGHPASYDWATEPARDYAVFADLPHVLWEELFRRLTTPDADWGGGHASYFGRSAAARALAALSAAAVSYGRELAGLPPLSPAPERRS